MRILNDLRKISKRNGREGTIMLTLLYFERASFIKWPFKLMKMLCQGHYLCDISPYSFNSRNAIVTCRLPHPFVIIINSNTIIGENVTIYHSVTIGSRERQGEEKSESTIISDNVYIGCGATILGNVLIGKNSKVAAHSIVLCNVDDNCTVSGVVK